MFDLKIYFRIITITFSSNCPRNPLSELRSLIKKIRFSHDTCSSCWEGRTNYIQFERNSRCDLLWKWIAISKAERQEKNDYTYDRYCRISLGVTVNRRSLGQPNRACVQANPDDSFRFRFLSNETFPNVVCAIVRATNGKIKISRKTSKGRDKV